MITLAACAILGLTGCISRQEGCLDPGAANYDLEAERACSSCCTYPSLSLEWSPKWAAENFSLADTFRDVEGRPYLILDLRFLLESWQWADDQGVIYTVDSTSIGCGADELNWTPDFAQVTPTQFVYTLGTFRDFPHAQALRFSFGPTRDYSCLDPAESGTPVFLTQAGPLWDPETQSLSSMRLIIQPDLQLPDADTLYFHDMAELQLPYSLLFERGRAGQFRLTADYAQWFTAADLDDPDSFRESWLAGLAGSVTLTP